MKLPVAAFALTSVLWLARATPCTAEGESAAAIAQAEAKAEPVTFNKQIAPILFRQCVECHRPGEVAPFSLLTYEDAKKRSKMIRTVTADHIMPPWKSVAGHGSFIGERRLSATELDLIDKLGFSREAGRRRKGSARSSSIH